MPGQILIIETDSTLRTKLVQYLYQKAFDVLIADQKQTALDTLKRIWKNDPLILLGLEGLKREGIAILEMIRKAYPELKVIIMNTGDQFDLSIEAMRLGAFDDILIPIDLNGLINCLGKAQSSETNMHHTNEYNSN